MVHVKTALFPALALAIGGCDPGNLYGFMGDYGVRLESSSGCITFDMSSLDLQTPYTLDIYLRSEPEAEGNDIPLAVWPGAFSLYATSDGDLMVGASDITNPKQALARVDILDGDYHHVAFTLDTANQARIFVDGAMMTSPTKIPVQDPRDSLHLACWPDGSNVVFPGVIGEVRLTASVVYNASFTPSWIEYSPSEDTMALWHLNEGHGTSLLDEVGVASGSFSAGEWVPFTLDGSRPQPDQ